VREVLTSSLRLQVTPRDAQVLVDGYAAGEVDDYDGIFQRLRLRPGEHELVLFLDGYRTVRQNLYLNPGSDQKIEFTMERLGSGEGAEPPPPPARLPADDDRSIRPGPGPRGTPQGERPSRFGTLSIRVQPADADVFIDGERWNAVDGDRLVVDLAEGRHHVEVRKSGFSTYERDITIRAGSSMPLNVSLVR
jgi:hypothetical protein